MEIAEQLIEEVLRVLPKAAMDKHSNLTVSILHIEGYDVYLDGEFIPMDIGAAIKQRREEIHQEATKARYVRYLEELRSVN